MIRRKTFYRTSGQLKAVFSLSAGGITQEIIGYSKASYSVYDDKDKLFENALLDAKYKFLKDNNFISNIEEVYFNKEVSQLKKVDYYLIDYSIKYFDDDIKIKREKWKGKYFNVVRDKNGRFVSRVKYSSSKYDDEEIIPFYEDTPEAEKLDFTQRFN